MTSPSISRPLRLAGLFLVASTALAAIAPGAMAQALGNRFNGLQVSGDQPIAIESDQLDVDDAKAIAIFTGNVAVAQGETQMKADKLVVHYTKTNEGQPATASAKPAAARALPGGSNEIEKLEASGKVYVKSTEQVATSDKADFDMKTQIAVMKGNVVLTQGENVARGDTLTIHMDTGIARLGGSGRVKMMLAPQQSPSGAQ